MFTVDGFAWNIPCEIVRTAELKASEISGMLLDKSYFNDVLGMWLIYDIKVVVPHNKLSEYTQLYEILTGTEDAHSFVLPYNQGTITITAFVKQVKDVWHRTAKGSYWEGIQFQVVGSHPSKNNTLSGVIDRGMTPLPAEMDVADGTLAQKGTDGWTVVQIANADNNSY